MKSANDTFKLLNSEKQKVSKAVLEFAEMSILLARNKFPENFFEQAKLIADKFNEKYKTEVAKFNSSWHCSVFVVGYGANYITYHHIIKLGFNNLKYTIWI